jgi:hypothetical protein
MAADSSAVEQAVSRALRDNLERIQRASDELHQAIADVVAACASSRPTNALPPMVRAQAASAGLAAALEVLSRFVTVALQPVMRSADEREILRVTSLPVPEPPLPYERPEPLLPQPMGENLWTPPASFDAPPAEPMQVAEPPALNVPTPDEFVPSMDAPPAAEAVPLVADEPAASEPEPEMGAPPPVAIEAPQAGREFNVASLPADQQELHRRAYRVAKVSMQDIKMLRPEDVRLGRENKDLCLRLRDDIEKAHKEYDRRFQPILDHPVDYFYDWMVEILAGGDPQALGEYPYPSAVLRR